MELKTPMPPASLRDQHFQFTDHVSRAGLDLKPGTIDTLQINITKLCNQACVHCHVDASPRRREMMNDAVIDQVLKVLKDNPELQTLDITGGAPELHPRFMELVRQGRALGRKVWVRHNLTVMLDPHPLTKESMEYLADFFAEQQVEVVSSLPYYQEFFTDKQRGDGVFKKSIEAMRRLNARGFGVPGTGLMFNLVYNPVGSFLPAPQADLERDYHRELQALFQVQFNHLFAITNMPIHRFKVQLIRMGSYEEYMEKLVASFNPQAAAGIMCRNLISVAYDGALYDCDFNQMLKMPLLVNDQRQDIFTFHRTQLAQRTIAVADHCFGCTAGAGSSCGGTTA
ncbi:MAG TPA: arsenosugar biosynthesis radical SAM (seleno)protein ArsS [Oligoflexus sp.]|uniref:arsenosugar biosynthesis radical SAM (seleno)protein ArsS n=1 Tax=Oligoflexus sp. TaxID=1971216 RepID=UPI002D666623|nr:arsenosugar biosynthesis radical SAM (seleno)protein ArsS [Oligoflexus sp.]HYX36230.1 arsenosugar biosynthesis radical SAM (seleno)protein ArsS [Oligoflexus sp.]